MYDHPIIPHLRRFGAALGELSGTWLPISLRGPGAAGPEVRFDVELGNRSLVRLRAYRQMSLEPARNPTMFLQALATANYQTRLVKLIADMPQHLLVAHVDLPTGGVPLGFDQVKRSLFLLNEVIKRRGSELEAVWRTGEALRDSEADELMSRLVVASVLAAVRDAARASATPSGAAPPPSGGPQRAAPQTPPRAHPSSTPPRRPAEPASRGPRKDFSFEGVLDDAIHNRDVDNE